MYGLAFKESKLISQFRVQQKQAVQTGKIPTKKLDLGVSTSTPGKSISDQVLKVSIDNTYIPPNVQSILVQKNLPMDDQNDGRHSYSQIKKIFDNKNMTFAQVRSIINVIDVDNSGDISFNEWSHFFDIFWMPFKNCDTLNTFMLNQDEMLKCLTNTIKPGYVFNNFLDILPDSINKILYLIDGPNGLNFYNYLYLRKVNLALENCSENQLISPQKIYCSLQFTSPKIKKLQIPDEKELFISAQILKDGYYSGQTSTINLIQFIGISYVYNYFTEYEIPFDDGFIRKSDMIKAIEDQTLPPYLTPFIAECFFEQTEEMNFFSFIMNLFSYRQFISISFQENEQYVMNFTAFTKVTQKALPNRLAFVINQSIVPSQFELETASQRMHNQVELNENNYIQGFNNLIFLQKTSKTSKIQKIQKAKQKFDKNDWKTTSMAPTYQSTKVQDSNGVPFLVQASTSAQQFHKTEQSYQQDYQNYLHPQGSLLIYQIFDTYNNDTINEVTYFKFQRLSTLYLQMDPFGLQRITSKNIILQKSQFFISLLNPSEKQLFFQLQDFLQKQNDLFMNYKQFISWFMIKDAFSYIKISGTSFTSTFSRSLQGFQKLGLRLSDYAIKSSLKGYTNQFQEQTFLFRQAFFIALNEEMVTMRQRYFSQGILNSGFVP